MIAQLSSGHFDAADALLLAAFVLLALATLINALGSTIALVKGSHTMTLVFAGWACIALALFVA